MNKISLKINPKIKLPKEFKNFLKKNTSTMLKAQNLNNKILDIYITTDEEIHNLNKAYRNKDKPTDVLSFSIDEYINNMHYLGEIVLSYETALKQANEQDISIENEILRLIAHGITHLLGYDHELSKEDEKVFFEKQNNILASCTF